MKALWGLIWFVLLWLLILIMLAIGNPGKGHRGRPPPTPTPTPTATPPPPSPSPSPTPLPTPPSVTLAWDPPSDTTGITGYALWVGFSSGGENQENDLGPVLTTTLTLNPATTYFFYVTSYDANHTMSIPSNEVSYSTP
jgi:hypothetical protein